MAELYGNNISLTDGLSIKSQKPVDDRILFNTHADLISLVNITNRVARYYKGMYARVLQTNNEYVWKPEPDQNNPAGEIPGAFTYTGAPYRADYTNIKYNFFLVRENEGSAATANRFVMNIMRRLDLNNPSENVFTIDLGYNSNYNESGNFNLRLGQDITEFENNNVDILLNGTVLEKIGDFKQLEYINSTMFRIKIPIITNDTNLVDPFDYIDFLDKGDTITIKHT
jgi:hypothetical protein